jgi:hypothetical protein
VQQEGKFTLREWNRNFSKLLILFLHQVIGGQGIDDTMKMIKDAGFDGEIESTDH